MENGEHLTQGYDDDIFARCIRLTVEGMAGYAACGPLGTRCSTCQHFGYWRHRRDSAGVISSSFWRQRGCWMFHKLTGRHGPSIKGDPESCRYFEPKPEGSAT